MDGLISAGGGLKPGGLKSGILRYPDCLQPVEQ